MQKEQLSFPGDLEGCNATQHRGSQAYVADKFTITNELNYTYKLWEWSFLAQHGASSCLTADNLDFC